MRCKSSLSFILILVLNPFLSFAEVTKTHTICTASLNSADERDVFVKELSHQKNKNGSLAFQFVELVPDKPPSSESLEKWFWDACEKKIKCDVLIISGHFTGSFSGDSKHRLSIETLEQAACQKKCEGILSEPKEVFLMGCNTLDGGSGDYRERSVINFQNHLSYSAYEAEMDVIERAGLLGAGYKQRMKSVFNSVPALYGFYSSGPSGSNARPILEKYLKSKNMKDHLIRLSSAKETRLQSLADTRSHKEDPLQFPINADLNQCFGEKKAYFCQTPGGFQAETQRTLQCELKIAKEEDLLKVLSEHSKLLSPSEVLQYVFKLLDDVGFDPKATKESDEPIDKVEYGYWKKIVTAPAIKSHIRKLWRESGAYTKLLLNDWFVSMDISPPKDVSSVTRQAVSEILKSKLDEDSIDFIDDRNPDEWEHIQKTAFDFRSVTSFFCKDQDGDLSSRLSLLNGVYDLTEHFFEDLINRCKHYKDANFDDLVSELDDFLNRRKQKLSDQTIDFLYSKVESLRLNRILINAVHRVDQDTVQRIFLRQLTFAKGLSESRESSEIIRSMLKDRFLRLSENNWAPLINDKEGRRLPFLGRPFLDFLKRASESMTFVDELQSHERTAVFNLIALDHLVDADLEVFFKVISNLLKYESRKIKEEILPALELRFKQGQFKSKESEKLIQLWKAKVSH